MASQPVRLTYFPATDSMLTDPNVTALDPGDLLLQQGILVTNQFPTSDISFKLSFDRQAWGSYGLGALYSSIFSLQNQAGCYFEVTTTYSEDRVVRKEYYLNRGRCYSIYWNKKDSCWDMKRNRCRR
ncbi:hypothetical protein CEQ90_03585 [Lewinellaceae bacterium SD302]|nr:hypothetical protein CEQ90_03585 [Lewinellaceae bacterium SD302]